MEEMEGIGRFESRLCPRLCGCCHEEAVGVIS